MLGNCSFEFNLLAAKVSSGADDFVKSRDVVMGGNETWWLKSIYFVGN